MSLLIELLRLVLGLAIRFLSPSFSQADYSQNLLKDDYSLFG